MKLVKSGSLLGLLMVILLVQTSSSQNMSSTTKPSGNTQPQTTAMPMTTEPSGGMSQATTVPSRSNETPATSEPNDNVMTCGRIECPPESVSCLVIVQTDPNNQTLVIVTSKCMDSRELTVAQNATSEPNTYGCDIYIETLNGVMSVRQAIAFETVLETLGLIEELEYVAELDEIREELEIDNAVRDYFWG